MQFRPSHIGVIKFGLENGMLGPTVDALGATPTLWHMGYGSLPNIQMRENAAVVQAVGTPYGVDTVPGDRDITFSVNLKIGSLAIIPYLIRNSGISPSMYGMPVLALHGGSDSTWGGENFSWICRYCICNSFTLRFAEGSGSHISLEAQFTALALDESGAAQSVNLASMNAVGGKVLTWAHSSINIGGTAYRRFIGSASVTVNNNVQPDGRREEIAGNSLSRCPVQLIPHHELVTTQFALKDKLPSNLRGELGSIVIAANNSAAGAASPKGLSLAITHNYLNSHSLNQAEVGQPMSFAADTVSRVLAITTSGT